MNAPRGDDLERRLTELFEKRAATVTQARRVDLSADDSNRTGAAPGSVRSGRLRQNLGRLAVAAAVLVMIVGLGIQASLPPSQERDGGGSKPPETVHEAAGGRRPAMPSCTVTAPDRWLGAIEAGVVPVDRTFNLVASVNGDTGDYLAIQGNEPPSQTSAIYTDIEVALFRGSRGVTIYTPEGSDIPRADPTGAITADWVTFALAQPQNLDYSYKVMLYDRGSGFTSMLAEFPPSQDSQGKTVLGAPVIAAGKVYWLSTVHNKPKLTSLESWDLARNSAAKAVPAAGATGLVSYGSGVALIREGPSAATLSNGGGAPLPSWITSAVAGSNFGFDGRGGLSYLRQEHDRTVFYALTVKPYSLEGIHFSAPGSFAKAAISPLLAADSGYSLLDLRSGASVSLPEGVTLQGVVGDEVIFGTGTTKSGATGLSRVALTDLPPVRC